MIFPIKATKEENKEFEDKFNKGCGEFIRKLPGAIFCEKYGYFTDALDNEGVCPSCSPNSPPEALTDGTLEDKDPDTSKLVDDTLVLDENSGSDTPLSDKIKYEKERAVGLNGDIWTAIQRIEVDVAEAVRKLKVSINKLNGIFNTGTDDIFREIDKIFGVLE